MIVYRNTVTGRLSRHAEPVPSMDKADRWERVDEPEVAPEAAPRKRVGAARKPRARKTASGDRASSESDE